MAGPTALSEVGFWQIFHRYVESIDAAREFFTQISPRASEMDAHALEEQKRRMAELTLKLLKRKGLGFDDLDEFVTTTFDPLAEGLARSISSKSMEVDKAARFTLTIDDSEPELAADKAQLFMDAIRVIVGEAKLPGIHRESLNRSVLLSLVANFEVLIADLARRRYRQFPEAIGRQRQVSVEVLRTFARVDDVLDHIVSDLIDELLRGSFERWFKFLEQHMSIDPSRVVPDASQWAEMFQRRHVVVHAGGHASRQYREKVDWTRVRWPSHRPPLDDPLVTENEYIWYALDVFQTVGMLLCQSAWKKLAPQESEERYTSLARVIFGAADAALWQVVRWLSTWGTEDGGFTVAQSSQLSLVACLSSMRAYCESW